MGYTNKGDGPLYLESKGIHASHMLLDEFFTMFIPFRSIVLQEAFVPGGFSPWACATSTCIVSRV